MCGIIGYIGFSDPKGVLLDGLKRLEYRGYDSAGIAIIEHSGVEVFRCEGRIDNLESKLTNHQFRGSVGIGHTRWATHGAPTEINAHPHKVGAVTLVHNGIIENYIEHRDRVLDLGRTLSSDTDSEIVAHLIDLEVQTGKTLTNALLTVLPQLKGSYAFVILCEKEPDKLIGVRNGAPLLVGIGDGENFVASDVQAILSHTSNIIYLEDHQFVICEKDKVSVFSDKGGKVKPQVKRIHWTPDQMDKAGYRHYMLKEIHEQTTALANTIHDNINHRTGTIRCAELREAAPLLRKIKKISMVACGTARHAALVGKNYFEQLAKIPVDVDYASEFRYRNPILDDETLLICISQSGETADTLAGLREGLSKKIPTLSICNVRESTMTRESRFVMYTNAGPEISVASTKAFTTQVGILYMLAVEMGELLGHISKEQAKKLTQDLVRLPILVEQTLALEKHIETIAAAHEGSDFFFYMGRGIEYPIALEGALKLKEISYCHAEGYPAGELKHGPIALIDRNTTVIVLAPQNNLTIYDKLMSNLQEVKSRGGRIWTISTTTDWDGTTNSDTTAGSAKTPGSAKTAGSAKVNGSAIKEACPFARESDYFLAIPQASWALNPILMTIPLQLFAYHVALQKGTDVDKPRNLAKSVTVE